MKKILQESELGGAIGLPMIFCSAAYLIFSQGAGRVMTMHNQNNLDFWRGRRKTRARVKELKEVTPYSYSTSFKTPGIDILTHMSHFLDPGHLVSVHRYTLLGIKLQNCQNVEFGEDNNHPYMKFQVKGPGSTADAKLTILGPFDIEMNVKQNKSEMNIIFSANKGYDGTELEVSMFTNSRIGAMVLAPVTAITYLEDSFYLKNEQKRIHEIYGGKDHETETSPLRALFRHYKDHYAAHIDILIAQVCDDYSCDNISHKKHDHNPVSPRPK